MLIKTLNSQYVIWLKQGLWHGYFLEKFPKTDDSIRLFLNCTCSISHSKNLFCYYFFNVTLNVKRQFLKIATFEPIISTEYVWIEVLRDLHRKNFQEFSQPESGSDPVYQSVQCPELSVKSAAFRIQSRTPRVQCLESREQCPDWKVQSLEYRVQPSQTSVQDLRPEYGKSGCPSRVVYCYCYREKDCLFFNFLGFLSRTFTIHRTAGEEGGYLFNFSRPLPPVSQALTHYPGNYCRGLASARSMQPDSNQGPLISERKSLITKLRALL